MLAEKIADELGLVVSGRLAGGEWGAFAATDTGGERVVLKLMPRHASATLDGVRRAIELVEGLRATGYPAPRYLDVGEIEDTVYTVQAFVDGVVPDVLGEPHARRLVELTSMHADVAASEPGQEHEWGAEVVQALRVGNEKVWTDHGVLHTAAPPIPGLLDEIVAVGQRTDAAMFRDTDVVHSDFHHRNLLVVGDEVTAVFDWESATIGDARCDLAKLAFWCEASVGSQVEPAAAKHVLAAAEAIPTDVRAAFAALFALQMFTFVVRTRPEYYDWMIAVVERALVPRWRH